MNSFYLLIISLINDLPASVKANLGNNFTLIGADTAIVTIIKNTKILFNFILSPKLLIFKFKQLKINWMQVIESSFLLYQKTFLIKMQIHNANKLFELTHLINEVSAAENFRIYKIILKSKNLVLWRRIKLLWLQN